MSAAIIDHSLQKERQFCHHFKPFLAQTYLDPIATRQRFKLKNPPTFCHQVHIRIHFFMTKFHLRHNLFLNTQNNLSSHLPPFSPFFAPHILEYTNNQSANEIQDIYIYIYSCKMGARAQSLFSTRALSPLM